MNNSHRTVLIAGGSGLIGRHLSHLLRGSGHKVKILTRAPSDHASGIYNWDPDRKHADPEAFEGTDAIVNLAGASVAEKLWTPWRKRHLVNSRIFPTRFIYEQVKNNPGKFSVVINASAIGIYGNTGAQIIHEDYEKAGNFLARTCVQWEEEADRISETGVRTVILRIGNVLARDGGVWPLIMMPFRYRLALIFGSGSQYFSWIHIDDLCCMISDCLNKDSFNGVYNAVAPGPIDYRNVVTLIRQIRKKHHLTVPVPSFLLQMLLGGLSQLLTDGNRVSPQKIEDDGFRFNFPDAGSAFRDLLHQD